MSEPWRVVWYHTETGRRVAVCGDRGHKYMTAISIYDNGVTAARVPLTDERYMQACRYDARTAARKMLRIGRALGMSPPAERALKSIASSGACA